MKLNNEVREKINDYYNSCKLKYYYHLEAAVKFKKMYIYTTMPIIIFSSITTVLASYNGSTVDQRLAIAVAIFSGLTTIGQALISFFEYGAKYERHFAISNKYINLSRMIDNEVYINFWNTKDEPETDNKVYVKFLFDKIYAEFISIQDIELYLPSQSSTRAYAEISSSVVTKIPIRADPDAIISINDNITTGDQSFNDLRNTPTIVTTL